MGEDTLECRAHIKGPSAGMHRQPTGLTANAPGAQSLVTLKIVFCDRAARRFGDVNASIRNRNAIRLAARSDPPDRGQRTPIILKDADGALAAEGNVDLIVE